MHGEQLGWEYLRLEQPDVPITELNALGADGWELVSGRGPMYFKRPAPGFRERVTLDQKRAVYERAGLPWPPSSQSSGQE